MKSPSMLPLSTIKERSNQMKYKTCTGEGLHKILSMQGGDGDDSYAKNSDAPALAINLSKPLLIEAIHLMTLLQDEECLRIADLGCATGNNTLSLVELVVENLKERYCKELGTEPEFEVFFSDLPSNDFNSLFRSLPPLNDSKKAQYYAAGVPGSFYHRLFPKGKLHLAVSLSALQWLSHLPEDVLDKKSLAWNEGRVWIDGAKTQVVEAYAKLAEEDLNAFLQCRKVEMARGGMLFILMAGRPRLSCSENQLDGADTRAKHPFTSSMDLAWEDLLNEGLIDRGTRDTFNIPVYMRSVSEVEKAFEKCPGFEIKRLEYHRIPEHSKEKQEEWIKDPVSYGKAKANMVRATLNPIVEAHLGPNLSHELFKRFEMRVSNDLGMLQKTCFYGVIIACAIKQ
ncbi:tyramine N-methyltransferase [Ranunculus cassubicifolius]